MNKIMIMIIMIVAAAIILSGVSQTRNHILLSKIKPVKFVIDRDSDILVKVESIRYNEFRIIATRGKVK